MPLVLPLAVVGLAMFLFLLVYAFRVTIGNLLVAMAQQIPVIGGYIARALESVFTWTENKIKAFLKTLTLSLVHWLVHLAAYVADPIEAVSAFAEAVRNAFDVLTHQTIPAFVGSVAGDIQRKVEIAIQWATDAGTKVDRLAATMAADASATYGQIQSEVAHGIDRLRVDLDGAFTARIANGIDVLKRDLTAEVFQTQHGLDVLAGDISRDFAGAEAAVRSGLGDLEQQALDVERGIASGNFGALAKVLAGLAGFTALLARESGLARRECRGRVRGVCEADGAAWDDLLAGLIGGIVMLDFSEMVNVARGLAEELSGDIENYIGKH